MDDLRKRLPTAQASEVRQKIEAAREVFEIDANVADGDLDGPRRLLWRPTGWWRTSR